MTRKSVDKTENIKQINIVLLGDFNFSQSITVLTTVSNEELERLRIEYIKFKKTQGVDVIFTWETANVQDIAVTPDDLKKILWSE